MWISLLILQVALVSAYPKPWNCQSISNEVLIISTKKMTANYDSNYKFTITFWRPFLSPPTLHLALNDFKSSYAYHLTEWTFLSSNTTHAIVGFESTRNLTEPGLFSTVSYIASVLPQVEIISKYLMLDFAFDGTKKTKQFEHKYAKPKTTDFVVPPIFSVIGFMGNYRGLSLALDHTSNNSTQLQINATSQAYTTGTLVWVKLSIILVNYGDTITKDAYINFGNTLKINNRTENTSGCTDYLFYASETIDRMVDVPVSGYMKSSLNGSLNSTHFNISTNLSFSHSPVGSDYALFSYFIFGIRTCPTNFYFNQIYKDCRCNDTAFLFYNASYSRTECQPQCPNNRLYYPTSKGCVSCIEKHSAKCSSCDANGCLSCTDKSVVNQLNGQCQCKLGYCEAPSGSCIQTKKDCLSCTNSADCLTCRALYYLNQDTCKPCSWLDIQAHSFCTSQQIVSHFKQKAGIWDYFVLTILGIISILMLCLLIWGLVVCCRCMIKSTKEQNQDQSDAQQGNEQENQQQNQQKVQAEEEGPAETSVRLSQEL